MTTKEFNDLTAGDTVELKAQGKPAVPGIVVRMTTKGVRVLWLDGDETVVPHIFAPFLDMAVRPIGPCAVGRDRLPEDPSGGDRT